MNVKQVPWWRKALDFALSGIRSGFGLFAKTPKESAAVEPDIVVLDDEIKKEIREEAELTEQFPEKNFAEAEFPDADEIAEQVVAEQVIHPAGEMAAQSVVARAAGQIPAQVDSAIAVLDEVEAASVSQEIIESQVVDEVVEPIVESVGDPVIEPVIDSVSDSVSDLVETAAPAPTPELEAETAPADAEPAVELMQDEIAFAESPVDDVPSPDPAIVAELETVEVTELQHVPEATLEIEDVPAIADAEPCPSIESDLQEPELEIAPVPEAEIASEQVTDLRVTVENECVDEFAPQAEAAISEVAELELSSLVLEPVLETGPQPALDAMPAETIELDVTQPAAEPAPLDDDDKAGQLLEDTIEEQHDDIENIEAGHDEIENVEIDETVAEHMDVNQTNPEQAEEYVTAQEIPSEAALSAATQDGSTSNQEPSAAAQTAADELEGLANEEPAKVAHAAQHPSRPFIKRESPADQTNASPFSVIVSQVYDGPLDLLLDLIRKQDIDIYDIPIARITAQFLAYVNQLKAGDVDVAGEFIYTASLLIHIKSKMLLPRAPSGPEDAAEDPRRELVERLLEHERFKNAAQMLQQKQMLEAATWSNPGVRDFKEDTAAEPEIAADTVDLVRVFRDILDRARNRPVLNVEEDSVTVSQMIQFLSRRLNMEDKPIALRRLLSHSRSERALIAMFLALLELVRLQAILLRQDLAFSEIFIKKSSDFESVMSAGVAQDDWK